MRRIARLRAASIRSRWRAKAAAGPSYSIGDVARIT
jgi:hypothetical protein